VVEAIAGSGGMAVAMSANVANESAINEMFNEVVSSFGGIDVVIHAAGILPVKPLAEFTMIEIDEVLAINLCGTFVVKL
jgi:3-oxoacyl-[acyl-carrier protein] reductase